MWRAGTDDRKCWLQEEQQAILGADFVLRHETQKLRKTLRGAPYVCSHLCLGVCANLHSIISICDSTKRNAIFTTVICPLAYCRTHKKQASNDPHPSSKPLLALGGNHFRSLSAFLCLISSCFLPLPPFFFYLSFYLLAIFYYENYPFAKMSNFLYYRTFAPPPPHQLFSVWFIDGLAQAQESPLIINSKQIPTSTRFTPVIEDRTLTFQL